MKKFDYRELKPRRITIVSGLTADGFYKAIIAEVDFLNEYVSYSLVKGADVVRDFGQMSLHDLTVEFNELG
jgi:hypothetical protein